MHLFGGMNHNSIIMDNCQIHHSDTVQKLLEDAGILCLYLLWGAVCVKIHENYTVT